jgi:acyl-CoA thioester hydrolase
VKGERFREVHVEHVVPFHYVDALQVVWPGHYFKYFELARTALLRSCALDAGDLVDTRYRFLVVAARSRHVGPLRYGDRMRIHAWLSDVGRRIGIAYEIWNLTLDRRAARGHTDLAIVDAEGSLQLTLPEEIGARIRGPGHEDP